MQYVVKNYDILVLSASHGSYITYHNYIQNAKQELRL
jgi:hypothetical protein